MDADLVLYALVDPAVAGGHKLADLARDIAGSATLVQLRDKHGSTRRMMEKARALIGVSIKTLEQAAAAPLDLLDYVAIGGVYGTTSKENPSAPIGLAGLRSIAQAVRARKPNFPICAIAGINESNAAAVIEAGADGVAVISALSLIAEPAKAARALRNVVDVALERRRRSA